MMEQNTVAPPTLTDPGTPGPLVSVALCTYNGAHFLTEQLDSLSKQTYPFLEIVVGDDCSTDDTVAILRRYAERDARIRVAVNEANLGFAANFETVLRRCRGAFVAPCDHDDIWLPTKIEALMHAIGPRSLAYCDSTLIDAHGRQIGYRMSDIVPMLSTDDPAAFAFGNCVSGHAMLFRAELLNDALPVPRGFFYDWWLAAVAAAAKGVVFCDRSLVFYRQHGANITDKRLTEMIAESGLSRAARDSAAVQQTASAPRGEKLRHLQETAERLRALTRLPGRHRAFLADLSRLWSARENQWLSPTLAYLMLRHRRRLFAVTKWSARRQSRYCRQLFWGVRAKRLGNEDAY